MGTIVTYHKAFDESLSVIRGFSDEIRARDMEPGTKIAHISIIKADQRLAGIFGLEIDSPLYYLEKNLYGRRGSHCTFSNLPANTM